jgi:uncharacterized protein
MQNKSGQISTAIVALLVVVVLLASSTLYLTLLVSQKSTNSTTGGAPQQTLHLALSNGAGASSQTVISSSNSITVVGTGQSSYTPNEALIQVSVQTDNTTAVAATSSNAQDVVNVIKALNGIGIANSSIQTQGYSLSANYANCYSSCVPQIIGYTVTNSLQVNITSNSPTELGLNLGQVIDTSVKAGANGISLYFGASNAILNQTTNEALQNAVSSADSQAHAIASSLGVSITGVISATEGSPYYPQPSYGLYAAAAITSVQTPIMPGTQTVSETVQVVYSTS